MAWPLFIWLYAFEQAETQEQAIGIYSDRLPYFFSMALTKGNLDLGIGLAVFSLGLLVVGFLAQKNAPGIRMAITAIMMVLNFLSALLFISATI